MILSFLMLLLFLLQTYRIKSGCSHEAAEWGQYSLSVTIPLGSSIITVKWRRIGSRPLADRFLSQSNGEMRLESVCWVSMNRTYTLVTHRPPPTLAQAAAKNWKALSSSKMRSFESH
jgi:hypothetical protein